MSKEQYINMNEKFLKDLYWTVRSYSRYISLVIDTLQDSDADVEDESEAKLMLTAILEGVKNDLGAAYYPSLSIDQATNYISNLEVAQIVLDELADGIQEALTFEKLKYPRIFEEKREMWTNLLNMVGARMRFAIY